MAKKTISECFREYGAKQNNVQWSVSAWADEKTLVVSLWDHHRTTAARGVWVVEDQFDRWTGPGNNEFRENVRRAFDEGSDVKLVLAKTVEKERVQSGDDGSTISKEFSTFPDYTGKVTRADDAYCIEFRHESLG